MSIRIDEQVREENMNNDLAELTKLSHDYVASVQNSDVRRWQNIRPTSTAPVPTVAGRPRRVPAQTAKPVDQNLGPSVKIRILGDFAIITATATPCRMGSGPAPRIAGRQNGKWLAVSAHVTRVNHSSLPGDPAIHQA
jgi:hypothetical protein